MSLWDDFWEREKYSAVEPWLSSSKANDGKIKKLNLGSGNIIFEPNNGWTNLDMIEGENILKHDLTKLPLPFEDRQFDYILMMHILEHIPHNVPGYDGEFLEKLLSELIRITKSQGYWEIHGPDPRDIESLMCIGHIRHVGPRTFISLVNSKMLVPIDHSKDNWPTGYTCRIGELTDWHLRKYLGRDIGNGIAGLLGKPSVLRMIFKVIS